MGPKVCTNKCWCTAWKERKRGCDQFEPNQAKPTSLEMMNESTNSSVLSLQLISMVEESEPNKKKMCLLLKSERERESDELKTEADCGEWKMVKRVDVISSQEPEVSVGFGVQKIACILTFLLYSNTSAFAVLNQILCCVQHFCPFHWPSWPSISALNKFTNKKNFPSTSHENDLKLPTSYFTVC